jgi:sigma-B regulation protein RsbQ
MLSGMAKNYSDWIQHFSVSAIDDPKQPLLSEEFAQCLLKLSPDIALVVFKMIISSDYRQEVSQLKLPTLIIQPQNDMFVPLEVGLYLNESIEHSKIAILPTKGHFPQLTHPYIVADTIVKYLHKSSIKKIKDEEKI